VIFVCRKNLYVWSLASGKLMKVLDAHFGRIIALEPLIIGNWNSVSIEGNQELFAHLCTGDHRTGRGKLVQ
jgi:hypothetical protein